MTTMMTNLDKSKSFPTSSTFAKHSELPQLPVEVWEIVIDCVAMEVGHGMFPNRAGREQLVACSLVCQSWVPRSLFHLYEHLEINTADSLEHITYRLFTVRELCIRVETILVKCTPGTDQSWVSLIPLRLTGLTNLKSLLMHRFDFTKKTPNFYEVYRLYHVERLSLVDVTYSRYAQVTQLVSATCAKLLILNSNVQTRLSPSANPGRLLLGHLSNLTRLHLQITWEDLCTVSNDWIFYYPSIRIVAFKIQETQGSNEDSGRFLAKDSTAAWQRVAALFRGICLVEEEAVGKTHCVVSVGLGISKPICQMTSAYVGVGRPVPYIHLLSLGEIPELAPCVLEGLVSSRCRLHEIILPRLHDENASHLWKTIEDWLLNPHFDKLERCTIATDIEDASLVIDEPFACLHEEYKKRMPRIASKGVFDCTPDDCTLGRNAPAL
ncbi:hypothetical protein BXZ70DRAFT_762589 [Cristinia sonorae]|uniref:Uncharacterized protein n=1 Tax=Cristinia sonorae TaxID=1940300 RepID=A0A8K0US93_9AGAR|nr:hypothetical protein BXZ70DRAFT_762589 [Cristinia sonorae]